MYDIDYFRKIDYLNGSIRFLIFVILISWFSPLFSFFISVAYLLLSRNGNKGVVFSIAFLAMYSYFIIYFSRSFSDELSKDWSVYYDVYTKLVNDDYSAIFTFGGGLEIGWPVLYLLFSFLGISVDAVELAGVNLVVSVSLFFLWLYINIDKSKLLRENQELVLGATILFIALGSLGYMQRQALSIVFLLFAVTQRNTYSAVVFSVVSFLFHITALPLLALYFISLRINIPRIYLFSLVCILFDIRFFFYDIVYFLIGLNLGSGINNKLVYYTIGEEVGISISSFLICALLLILVIFKWNFISSRWKNIIAISLMSYVSFIGIPLLSERINFILYYVLGLFSCIVFLEGFRLNGSFYLRCVLIFYLILFSINKVYQSIDPVGHWYSYTPFSVFPFYYFIDL